MLTWKYMWHKNIILFWPLVMSSFFIHHLTGETFFTQYRKIRNQINTFERSVTKLTNNVKVKNQIRSLLKKYSKEKPQHILFSFRSGYKLGVGWVSLSLTLWPAPTPITKRGLFCPHPAPMGSHGSPSYPTLKFLFLFLINIIGFLEA